jgi:hypothetical protein
MAMRRWAVLTSRTGTLLAMIREVTMTLVEDDCSRVVAGYTRAAAVEAPSARSSDRCWLGEDVMGLQRTGATTCPCVTIGQGLV